MSVSGFIQTEYFVNDLQKPMISGQAFYQNDYFESLDEVDYSFLRNDTTGSIYLYVVNDLYESAIMIPQEIIGVLIEGSSDNPVTFSTTVDWLFGNVWHFSSFLNVTVNKKQIGGRDYLVFSSETVNCEQDMDSLFQLYDLYFDWTETGRIISRLRND